MTPERLAVLVGGPKHGQQIILPYRSSRVEFPVLEKNNTGILPYPQNILPYPGMIKRDVYYHRFATSGPPECSVYEYGGQEGG